MPCSECLTNFLDLSPVEGTLRSAIQTSLDAAQALPIEEFQNQLDTFGAYFDEVGDKLTANLTTIDVTADAIGQLQDAMLGAGIDPGECPELDGLVLMLGNLNTSIQGFLVNSVDKVFNTLDLGIADLNAAITSFNTLSVQAAEFSLC